MPDLYTNETNNGTLPHLPIGWILGGTKHHTCTIHASTCPIVSIVGGCEYIFFKIVLLEKGYVKVSIVEMLRHTKQPQLCSEALKCCT